MSADSPLGASGRRFEIDDLLDAARGVFFAEGFTAAQVSEIARAAGTTKPTLYARVGNKEQLYVRVVRREADVFQAQLAAAYERGGELPLHDLSEAGMEPLFRFARERPEGFHLLFRGESVDERATSIRRVVVAGVITRLADLIRRRDVLFGGGLSEAADLVAAACVGLARQVCEIAIDRGDDLEAAQHLAARFAESAIRNLGAEATSTVGRSVRD